MVRSRRTARRCGSRATGFDRARPEHPAQLQDASLHRLGPFLSAAARPTTHRRVSARRRRHGARDHSQHRPLPGSNAPASPSTVMDRARRSPPRLVIVRGGAATLNRAVTAPLPHSTPRDRRAWTMRTHPDFGGIIVMKRFHRQPGVVVAAAALVAAACTVPTTRRTTPPGHRADGTGDDRTCTPPVHSRRAPRAQLTRPPPSPRHHGTDRARPTPPDTPPASMKSTSTRRAAGILDAGGPSEHIRPTMSTAARPRRHPPGLGGRRP